jgi:hypothetical protein
MSITNFLGYKYWSPCWVYIILIITPLVKPFHIDIINLASFFFFDNHREYIKKAIKPIAKEKYKGYEKKKNLKNWFTTANNKKTT